MFRFSRLSASVFRAKLIKSPLRSSYEALTGFFTGDSREEQWRGAVLALIRTLLDENGTVSSEKLEIVRRLIESRRGAEEADRNMRVLKNVSSITPAEAAAALADLDQEQLEQLVKFLILLSLTARVFDTANRTLLADFAAAAGITDEQFDRLAVEAKAERTAQDHLIRSGAGLIAAIGVILVFILTATLLRSVIFGLIGAYLLLPLEKYFERKLRSGRGVCFFLARMAELLFLPLARLSLAVRRKNPENTVSRPPEKSDKKITRQAVSFTVMLVGIFVISGIVFISSLTGKYVGQLKNSVRNWQNTETAASGNFTTYTQKADDYVEKLKTRLENSPVIRQGVEFLQQVMEDEKTRNELGGMLLRSTGGVVNFTAGLLGTLLSIIGDVVLSVFFGLLFLFKLAEFCRKDSSSGKQSEYLVRTVFNGKWLPGANENTVAEARTVLSGTFMRLRIWVRGYLLLMLIDATVYTTAFCLLKVPYFPILGLIAGCGILLPYIGPVTGCLLTLLVTLAFGDASGMHLLLLLIFYLIYSGIIEQFILYPAVIGESLGLTTLETIIVVLLGAVFAGISGMILALPAASVLKYMVPQIYRYWGGENKKLLPNGRGQA